MREFENHPNQLSPAAHRVSLLSNRDAPPVNPVLRELSPRPEDTIVELGSAEGHFALPIAGRLSMLPGSGMMVALDSSRIFTRRLARAAAERGLNGHLRAICLEDAPTHTVPLPSESADSVLAVNALQYLADPLPYLKEIERVLSPLGTLIVAEWQRADKSGQHAPFFGRSPDDLAALLDAAGLEAHLQIDLDGYRWAVRAVKSTVAFA